MNGEKPDFQATRKDHALFVLVTVLYWCSLYIYVPILSPYMESLGASYTYVGIVLGSYGLMQILFRLPLGIWSDRLRTRKPFIAFGMLCAALSCIVFALTSQMGWTLAARAISGISASTWVAFTVLYAGYFKAKDATRAMGTISLITVVGQLLGMSLSGVLADKWGWHASFQAGIWVAAAGFVVALLLREPAGGVYRQPIQAKDLGKVMRDPMLIKVSVLSILAHCILFITMFGFTPSYAITLHASKSELSQLIFAFMIPHAIAAYVSGKWLAPRFGTWNVVIAGFVFSTIFTLAIPFTDSLSMLMVTQAFNGLAQGLHFPLLLGLSIQNVQPDKRATAMGFYQAAYAIGMFIGPFIAGWIIQSTGLSGGFYLGAAIGVAAAVFAIYIQGFGTSKEARKFWSVGK